MFTADYWNKRAEKYGHTGHSEPFYYCFDQQARLFAVSEIIKKTNFEKKSALDFGCGSGDFITLLAENYGLVYGYDISETILKKTRTKLRQSNVILKSHLSDCGYEGGFNLILTVTVLQYLTKKELNETIHSLSGLLSGNGKIVCMEFFVANDYNTKADTPKTTVSDWYEVLDKNNLKITTSYNFYNPILFPSHSWKTYTNILFLKFLKPFKHLSFVQMLFTKAALRLILKKKDVLFEKETAFKIFVIEKEKI